MVLGLVEMHLWQKPVGPLARMEVIPVLKTALVYILGMVASPIGRKGTGSHNKRNGHGSHTRKILVVFIPAMAVFFPEQWKR